MFEDMELLDTYFEKIPIGMKKKKCIYEFPYWQHLKITHCVDPMHVFKIVSSFLWRHISLNKIDTLYVSRHWERKGSRREVGDPSWSFKRVL